MVQKPFDLTLIDTKESIVNTLNESKLPLTAISMLIKEIDKMIDSQVTVSLEQLRKMYNQELEKEKSLELREENKNGN